jgi:hypothetical protein
MRGLPQEVRRHVVPNVIVGISVIVRAQIGWIELPHERVVAINETTTVRDFI